MMRWDWMDNLIRNPHGSTTLLIINNNASAELKKTVDGCGRTKPEQRLRFCILFHWDRTFQCLNINLQLLSSLLSDRYQDYEQQHCKDDEETVCNCLVAAGEKTEVSLCPIMSKMFLNVNKPNEFRNRNLVWKNCCCCSAIILLTTIFVTCINSTQLS